MRNFLFILTICFLVAGAATLHAVIHDVPTSFGTIQAGINAASPGDTVLVAPGTYTGNGNQDIDFGGKNIVVMSSAGPDVTVINCGGNAMTPHRGFYFHGNEPSSAMVKGFTITNGYQENIGGGICIVGSPFGRPYPTIVENVITNCQADYGGGIYVSWTSPTIVGNIIMGNTAVGGGGGIFCSAPSSFPLTDPVIVGNTVGPYNWAYDGGGIYCDENIGGLIEYNTITGNFVEQNGGGIYCNTQRTVSIQNNEISFNEFHFFGGGICCSQSSPNVVSNTIEGNMALNDPGSGGGIACLLGADPHIHDNTITNNNARSGGGIYCKEDSHPTIENNTISLNMFSDYGGGIFCYESSPDIVSNTIQGNIAVDYPGDGAGIGCHTNASPIISDNTITENEGRYGGGIFCLGNSSPHVADNRVEWNGASEGGGIYCTDYSDPILERNNIEGNHAHNCGGGMCLVENSSPQLFRDTVIDNDASDGGGVFVCGFSSPLFENVTFYLNYASSRGGGIKNGSATCTPTVVNCILWEDMAPFDPEIYDPYGSCSVTYSDIQGSWPGTGNINKYPGFNSPDTGDFTLFITSRCIDAGDPSYSAPPEGGYRIDIGAFEFSKKATTRGKHKVLIPRP